MKSQLYTLIDRNIIIEPAKIFYDCVGLPIKILDASGEILTQFGEEYDYCRHFSDHASSANVCSRTHTNIGKTASNYTEPYIFACSSNLFHIAYALTCNEKLYGSILVGPFLMGETDSTLVTELENHFTDFTTSDLMTLYDYSRQVPEIDTPRVSQICKLIAILFKDILSDFAEQLNSTPEDKPVISSTAIQYPFEKEALLLQNVKIGNLDKSKACLNDILGYIFSTAGDNVEELKMRSIELCSLLSRAAMEKGAPPNQTLALNNQYVKNLQDHQTIEDVCYSLNEVLETFINSLFPLVSAPNNRVIQDAMSYISSNYAEQLTLDQVAGYVHLNPAYLSRIFKQVCGVSFKGYLTTIRIEESKRLLKSTDLSLRDIAIATGFEDQSYFSKVFKKYTGLTPNQFRS